MKNPLLRRYGPPLLLLIAGSLGLTLGSTFGSEASAIAGFWLCVVGYIWWNVAAHRADPPRWIDAAALWLPVFAVLVWSGYLALPSGRPVDDIGLGLALSAAVVLAIVSGLGTAFHLLQRR